MVYMVKSWDLGASDVADYRNVSKMCKTKWRIQYGGHMFKIWQKSSKIGIWGLSMSLITKKKEKCVKKKWGFKKGGKNFKKIRKKKKIWKIRFAKPLKEKKKEKGPKRKGG